MLQHPFIPCSRWRPHHAFTADPLAASSTTPSRPCMNTDLQSFLRPLAQVIGATLFAVCTVAFVSMPYVLGHFPGDPAVLAQTDGTRHMT